jgi:nitroimidazol reductase NimA-like FMN-containing flavoprotein (pyridoxamine 5'-phosphate oxidase superfamily)
MDRNGLEVLDDGECRRLLAGQSFGRLAVTSGALPVILPVNFLLDDDRILIRTGAGTKLDAAMRDAVVAFEVDHAEPFSHGGWSVCVTGVARQIRDDAELARIGAMPLPHWAPNGVGHVMEISINLVSGRRVPRA